MPADKSLPGTLKRSRRKPRRPGSRRTTARLSNTATARGPTGRRSNHWSTPSRRSTTTGSARTRRARPTRVRRDVARRHVTAVERRSAVSTISGTPRPSSTIERATLAWGVDRRWTNWSWPAPSAASRP